MRISFVLVGLCVFRVMFFIQFFVDFTFSVNGVQDEQCFYDDFLFLKDKNCVKN